MAWYNSPFGGLAGLGVFFAGLGWAMSLGDSGHNANWRQVEQAKIQTSLEQQRMQTIAELSRNYSDSLNPREFQAYLDSLNLRERR